MVASRARAKVTPALAWNPGVLNVNEAARAFFFDELIAQMDAGIQQARPAPARPIGAPQQWACIGVETSYPWVDPYWSGPAWFGHVFVYEWPHDGISRRDRKALKSAMNDLQCAIGTLSRERRQELVRTAAIA
jgi:hypothetical protein